MCVDHCKYFGDTTFPLDNRAPMTILLLGSHSKPNSLNRYAISYCDGTSFPRLEQMLPTFRSLQLKTYGLRTDNNFT